MEHETSIISRDLSLLAPFFRARVTTALASCKSLGHSLAIFEAFRSPERQDWLYAQGRTRAGKVVTKARAWQSFHQYGLAFDCALFENGKWSWEFDPKAISAPFLAEGLEWLNPYEQCHFQMTGGLTISEARTIMTTRGLDALWQEIQKK